MNFRALCPCLLLAMAAGGAAAQTISGTITDGQGARLPSTGITLTDEAGPASRTVFTNAAGQYTVAAPAAGKFRLTVHRHGFVPATRSAIAAAAGSTVTVDVVLQPEYAHAASGSEWGWLLGVILGYLVTIAIARWNNVQWPIKRLLLAQIDSVATRLDTEVDASAPTGRIQGLQRYLAETRSEIQERAWFSEFLFWSRGKEISAWNRVHEVERQLVSFLVPAGRILARLATAEQELRVGNRGDSVAIAERIKTFLTALQTPPGTTPAHIEEGRELLAEGFANLYDHRDQKFATLMEWHNKANWLLVASLLLVALFGVSVGRNLIFAAGAAGGLLSRLARTLRRDDVPTDYGASWTTLYLSPVFGALSAWFGVTLIVLLVEAKMLGEAFLRVEWNNPAHPYALAVAFVLGFSERLFNSLVNALEGPGAAQGTGVTPQNFGTVASTAAGTVKPAASVVAGLLKVQTTSTVALSGHGLLWLEELAKAAGSIKAFVDTAAGAGAVTQRAVQAGLTNVQAIVIAPGVLQPSTLDAAALDDSTAPADLQQVRAALMQGGTLALISDVSGLSGSALQQKQIGVAMQLNALNVNASRAQTIPSGGKTFLFTTGQA